VVKTTKGIRRVLIVAVVALGAFGVAIVGLGDDARRGCVANSPVDPSYDAHLLGQLELARTQQQIELTRNGQPVTGAKVCARVAMVGMEAMGISDAKAKETSPGIYSVSIVFPMSGGWGGNLLIREQNSRQVKLPITFTVS